VLLNHRLEHCLSPRSSFLSSKQTETVESVVRVSVVCYPAVYLTCGVGLMVAAEVLMAIAEGSMAEISMRVAEMRRQRSSWADEADLATVA
jgi:hypothetical protein